MKEEEEEKELIKCFDEFCEAMCELKDLYLNYIPDPTTVDDMSKILWPF